jgi:hypothetical protein
MIEDEPNCVGKRKPFILTLLSGQSFSASILDDNAFLGTLEHSAQWGRLSDQDKVRSLVYRDLHW